MQPTTPPWRVLERVGPEASAPETGQTDQGALAARPPLFAVVAIGLAGLILVGAFLLASQAGGGAVEIHAASAGQSGPPGTSLAVPIVVEVAGAVVRPGLYNLSAGARVGDAISAAGGYGPRVDVGAAGRAINLAALVRDGDQIRVPSRDDPTPSADGPGEPASGAGGLVNLNRASATELEALPGIGPATAAKIVAARAERPFARVDDLLERKLVSSKVLESIRGLVTVG